MKWSYTLALPLLFTITMTGCKDDQNPVETTPAPAISSINPTSGPTGATVTITGSGFGATASANKVTFNGVLATVTSASSSSIEATVPEGATSGAVAVVVEGQTAVGPNFTVEEQMPGITAIEPDSGAAGTPLTIRGMNFDPNPSGNIVTFNGGVISTVDQASDTTLTTTVPVGAESGPILVEVGGQKTLSPDFKVLKRGTLEVTSVTTGQDIDPDGYTLTLDNGEIRALQPNHTVHFTDLAAGEYELDLADVTVNCRITGSETRTVSVQDGKTTDVTFNVDCAVVGQMLTRTGSIGGGDIWLMDGDGTDQVRMTENSEGDLQYHWSTDGTKFVFTRGISVSNDEIFMINPDNFSTTRLTDNSDTDNHPHWSPDGSLIAFASDRSGDWEVWVMDDSGFDPGTNLTNNAARDEDPRWSPDGSKIAFISDRSGEDRLWIMDADGSNQMQLSTVGADEPRWSPDGSEILFEGGELYKIDPDGTNQMNLTNNSVPNMQADWSPDGTMIVYRSGAVGNRDIWLMNADGSNQTNLTNNSNNETYPSWSPDGKRIVFSESADIWAIWYDGTALVNLTDDPNRTATVPIWRPEP